MKINKKSQRMGTIVLVSTLLLPQALWAQVGLSATDVNARPTAGQMAGDLLVARPIGVVMTVLGAAGFVVSLPFTLLAGNASEAAETLMIGPAETTFMRCLGCKQPGYSRQDIEQNQQHDED